MIDIALDSSHPCDPFFTRLPSGHRYRSLSWTRVHNSRSVVPSVITALYELPPAVTVPGLCGTTVWGNMMYTVYRVVCRSVGWCQLCSQKRAWVKGQCYVYACMPVRLRTDCDKKCSLRDKKVYLSIQAGGWKPDTLNSLMQGAY